MLPPKKAVSAWWSNSEDVELYLRNIAVLLKFPVFLESPYHLYKLLNSVRRHYGYFRDGGSDYKDWKKYGKISEELGRASECDRTIGSNPIPCILCKGKGNGEPSKRYSAPMRSIVTKWYTNCFGLEVAEKWASNPTAYDSACPATGTACEEISQIILNSRYIFCSSVTTSYWFI